ncbi:MAG TPA: TdeIII family type II restriction endonuclease [Armatimonadetes bacterium]|nr:TdeIII family type II restriction endonuclease [Armatimonadota bacterium]
MDKATREAAAETIEEGFYRILARIGDERQLRKRREQLHNVWLQLTLPGLDLLDSLTGPIKIGLGTVFEDLALVLARHQFDRVLPQYEVKGYLNPQTLLLIDDILADYKDRVRKPDTEAEKAALLAAQNPRAPEAIEDEQRVDLYLQRGEHVWLVEMKSSGKHDTTASAALKRKMLRAFALHNRPHTDIILGCAFNPYGEGAEFRWMPIRRTFEYGKELLVGRPFWNLLGQSETTYEELKEVWAAIGPTVERQAVDIINRALACLTDTRLRLKLEE